MQIDFHHAVTYVAARGAGFDHAEADKIAYAAQYVDDSTSDGTVCFGNKAMYTRISSAHRSVDTENLDDTKNHLVWLPFHFLPGNGGSEQRGSVGESFIEKIVCRPGYHSPVASDLLEATLATQGKQNALHRLGITMHVYADTWAHQGFAGVLHEINEVDDAEETDGSGAFRDLGEELGNWFAERVVPPLGHGRAQIFPDMPFLSWRYKNGKGKEIIRNNTEIFCEAADAMCRFMQRYRSVPDNGLPEEDAQEMRRLFVEVKDGDGAVRHCEWLKALKAGNFSFGPAEICYEDDGRNSWKAKALGTAYDLPVHDYRESFLESDWKMFHDALQQHRLDLLHDILPKYGICAA